VAVAERTARTQAAGGSGEKRAVVYCRVSTRKQEDEGTSLHSQAESCRRFAEDAGYTVVRVVQEVYTGAELWDRPLLTEIRAAVRHREYDALVVHATDRLSRNPIHMALVAEECERYSCELIFVTEPLDASPEGGLIRYIKGYAAEMERAKIKERMMRGRLQQLKDGKIHTWGSPLYGYTVDKEKRVREIKEDEAAIVRNIFRWVAYEGLSLRGVVRRLNERGIPSPAAGKIQLGRATYWGHNQVHRMLTDPSYKGETYVLRWDGGKRNTTMRSPADWLRLPDGTTPAIVSPDLWNEAQAHLPDGGASTATGEEPASPARPKRPNHGEQTRNLDRPFLLRGRIICAVCGRKMLPDMERGVRVYRCASRQTPQRSCGSGRAPAENCYSTPPRNEKGHLLRMTPELRAAGDVPGIEAWVWGEIVDVLSDPERVAAEVQRQQAEEPDETVSGDLEAARRLLAQCQQKQERLVSRYAAAEGDEFPWELIQQEIARIERQKKDLQAQVAELERRTELDRLAANQMTAFAEYCERVSRNLATFGFEEKRLALDALGITVYANGREWHVVGEVLLDASTGESGTASTRCARPPPPLPALASHAPGREYRSCPSRTRSAPGGRRSAQPAR